MNGARQLEIGETATAAAIGQRELRMDAGLEAATQIKAAVSPDAVPDDDRSRHIVPRPLRLPDGRIDQIVTDLHRHVRVPEVRDEGRGRRSNHKPAPIEGIAAKIN